MLAFQDVALELWKCIQLSCVSAYMKRRIYYSKTVSCQNYVFITFAKLQVLPSPKVFLFSISLYLLRSEYIHRIFSRSENFFVTALFFMPKVLFYSQVRTT